MTEPMHIRWVIELFDSSNIPDQGYVFFSCRKSYLCYPGETVEFFSDCLATATAALRRYLKQEPPEDLYVPYSKTARARPGNASRQLESA
ncbi:hypothetical protein Bsp3421_002911 [Burkholderia sp. FERM BP-3421]|uniref:hypothetical protein n=1 Tax=Burkholderia sp. FERM BP-3421 TaxID=1494466 RepID=UPI00235E5620|nr:hypothetical protein [Burkholderia sp. FERM BP-3421]WDD92875.1 hypothetical protein Bsp3421_002911 [Burkholderia sp. FERM BP-3421]